MSHTPVLLDEVLALLDPKPGAFVVDGTLDGGGYADAILPCIGEQGTLLGIDLDPSMVARFADRHATESSCRVVQGNYADLLAILLREHLAKANGLVLDLGFSSEQLEQSSRGFSFLRDEPLLMTYDPHETPVRELLRMLSESDLEHILRELGGERFARRVAKAIVTRCPKPTSAGGLIRRHERFKRSGFMRITNSGISRAFSPTYRRFSHPVGERLS